MSTNIDKPLDEIITHTRGSNRGFRGRRSRNMTLVNRRGPRNSRTRNSNMMDLDILRAPKASGIRKNVKSTGITTASLYPEGSKIIVSNLHFKVNERDLTELFSKVGTVRKVNLSYDSSGKSTGTASIVFGEKKDAAIAVKRYDQVTLDGRPMKIDVVVSGEEAVRKPLNTRLSFPPRGQNPRGRGRGSRRPGRGGARRDNRPTKTAEQLDAEINDYMLMDVDSSGPPPS